MISSLAIEIFQTITLQRNLTHRRMKFYACSIDYQLFYSTVIFLFNEGKQRAVDPPDHICRTSN